MITKPEAKIHIRSSLILLFCVTVTIERQERNRRFYKTNTLGMRKGVYLETCGDRIPISQTKNGEIAKKSFCLSKGVKSRTKRRITTKKIQEKGEIAKEDSLSYTRNTIESM